MRYSYLHPFAPQYFFQPECSKYSIFKSFYQSYTLPGAVSWWLWKNFNLYRCVFSKADIEKYVPENHIREIMEKDSIIAVNAGSPGPEQKITVIAVHNSHPVFLKYALTETAINLVNNEYSVLKFLQNSDLAPTIIDHFDGVDFSWIKTEFLCGRRVKDNYLSNNIFDAIQKVSSLDLFVGFPTATSLETSFAHGDFCPWNLMDVNGITKIFDWEMAGRYPIGYDLFTFIFQTNFLIYPKRKIEEIIRLNNQYIIDFFGGIDWKPYLSSFASLKLESESAKKNNRLVPHYRKLKEYARKA